MLYLFGKLKQILCFPYDVGILLLVCVKFIKIDNGNWFRVHKDQLFFVSPLPPA